jgi:5-methylcytosine-specific restriction endonuclease McrA
MARVLTTTERGLGWQHQKQRAALLRRHIDGTLCFWCGLPMYRSQALAADHSVARARGGRNADRLLHTPCNSERGDGTRDHLRPALHRAETIKRLAPSRDW